MIMANLSPPRSRFPGSIRRRRAPFGSPFILAVTGSCAVALLVCVLLTARDGVSRPDLAVTFAATIAIGQLLPVRLPGGRPVVPLAGAAASGYALLFDVGGRPVVQPLAQVVAVVGLGYGAGALLGVVVGRSPRVATLARRVLAALVVAAFFRAFAPGELFTSSFHDLRRVLPAVALFLIAAASVGMATEALLAVAERLARWRVPVTSLVRYVRDEFKATIGVAGAVTATAVLFALGVPVMRLYALPTFAVPLLLTQFAFRRFAAVRTTYRQTIRALAQVTELNGYVVRGHGRRVATLAVEIGRELGLSESQLADLEYAALLHDIGQLSLAEPIPAGSTLLIPPAERQRVAELGADVIRTTGVLDRVATIVARQADPYRRHREPPDPTVPIESRIIKAASAFDDVLTAARGLRSNGQETDPPSLQPEGEADAVADALERLRLGMAYEYDPRVVEALTAVLGRRLGVSLIAAG
ncbi:MAG: HD domain-containing protein [Acidothermus sp.]|nr:HD domain-containing protein [Acidothermus sp.]